MSGGSSVRIGDFAELVQRLSKLSHSLFAKVCFPLSRNSRDRRVGDRDPFLGSTGQ